MYSALQQKSRNMNFLNPRVEFTDVCMYSTYLHNTWVVMQPVHSHMYVRYNNEIKLSTCYQERRSNDDHLVLLRSRLTLTATRFLAGSGRYRFF